MTEDGTIVNVSVDAVFKKYREQTEAELSRLRYAVAQSETAIDILVSERDEARSDAGRARSELSETQRQQALPTERNPGGSARVPEAPGADLRHASARR